MRKKILLTLFAISIAGIYSQAQYFRMIPDEGFAYQYDSTALARDEVTAIYALYSELPTDWAKIERIIPKTVTYEGKKYKVTQINPSCLRVQQDDKYAY